MAIALAAAASPAHAASTALAPFYESFAGLFGACQTGSNFCADGSNISINTSNYSPAPASIASSFTTAAGSNVTGTAVATVGGFYTSHDSVSMSVTGAVPDDGFYAVAGYGSKTSVEFFNAPDLASSRFTWRVTGTLDNPYGWGGSRLDFATSLDNVDWFSLVAASPNSNTHFGPGVYSFDLPAVLNQQIYLYFWSSAFVQIDRGATYPANFTVSADFSHTYELVGIDLFNSLGERIDGWTMMDNNASCEASDPDVEDSEPVCTSQSYSQNDFLYTPPVATPEPGSLALLGFGLASLGFARRRRAAAQAA